MPRNNGNTNMNVNRAKENSAKLFINNIKAKNYEAAKAKKSKKTFRVANSGKFEHLRQQLASFKRTEKEYIKIMNQKMAKDMEQQNNQPKPDTAPEQVNQPKPENKINNENNLVVEEPKAKEELQKPTDDLTEINDAELMNLEDIKIDDSDLNDPALDDAIAQLEEQIKKEDELRAKGIDPESADKLDGEKLEEAFRSLSNKVDKERQGEVNNHDTDDFENDDPYVNEEYNRIAQEIKNEQEAANSKENKLDEQVNTNVNEEDDIIVEDVKENTEENKVAEPIQINDIKLLGEEKAEVSVENNVSKAETMPKNNDEKPVSEPASAVKQQIKTEAVKLPKMKPMYESSRIKKRFFVNRELYNQNVIAEHIDDEDSVETQYNIEKNVYKAKENETVNTHKLNMPDLENRLAQRRDNALLTSQVMNNLSAIIEEAGVKTQTNQLAQTAYQTLSKTMENNPSLKGKDPTMHEVAVAFYDDSYNMLANSGLSTADRIVTAQRISDVMLKGYSPIGLVNGELDQYSDNYVVNNNDLLKQHLVEKGNVSKENTESLMQDVKASLGKIAAKRQPEPKQEEEEKYVFMPRFHKNFSDRLKFTRVNDRAKSQISDILTESGITDKEKINALTDDIFQNNIAKIDDAYRPEDHTPGMPDFNNGYSMTKVSELATILFSTTYDQLIAKNADPRNMSVTTQRITDVILKTYSPVAFESKGKYDKFAKNYIISNKERHEECLRNSEIPQNDIEEILKKDTMEELRQELQIAKDFRQKQKTIDTEPEIEENSNEQKPISFEDLGKMKFNANPVSKQEPKKNEPPKFDAHQMFRSIEDKINNPKKPDEAPVIEPPAPPKEEPKPTYSVNKIPGMGAQVNPGEVKPMKTRSPEERKEQDVAFAKKMLETLRNNRKGTTEDLADRREQIKYYESILNKYKTFDERMEDSRKLAEQKARELKEREEKEKQLKELEEAARKEVFKDEENAPNTVANDKADIPEPRIPDFYTKLENNMISQDVTATVKAEMINIIKEAGITDKDEVFDVVEYSYFNIKDTIKSMYDSEVLIETRMSHDAPVFFDNAYQSLEKANLNKKDKIIAAQKIADVMLKNYSPAAFMKEEFKEYADKYVLRNKELLEERLNFYDVKNTENMMKYIDAELAGNPIKEPYEDKIDIAPEIKPEPDDDKFETTVFHRLLKQQMKEEKVTESAKSQISNILKESGVDKQEDADNLADKSMEIVDMIDAAYAPTGDGKGFEHSLKDFVRFVYTESYETISKQNLPIKDKLVTAQKISNVILEKYSPAAFTFGMDNVYYNNYLFTYKGALKDCMQMLNYSEDEINAAMRRDFLSELKQGAEQQKQNTEQQKVEQQNVEQQKVEQQKVDQPKREVEPPKKEAEPPKQEVAKTQPKATADDFDDLIDSRKPDAIERKLDDQKARERGEIDDLIDSRKPDAFEKKLAEQAAAKQKDKEKQKEKVNENKPAPAKPVETKAKDDDELTAKEKAYIERIKNQINDMKPKESPKKENNGPKIELNTTNSKKMNLIEMLRGDDDDEPEVNQNKKAPEKKTEAKAVKAIDDSANAAMFMEKLKTFNKMYKTNINADEFVSSVSDSWEKIKHYEKENGKKGYDQLKNTFKNVLKGAFDIEKNVAYNEHRLPEYTEIAKSANELMRASMYAFTDMYRTKSKSSFFKPTSFGGMNAKEMAELTSGNSLWNMDQKSNEAWAIQSKDAKAIANQWLKADKPHEKMIDAMNSLIEANKNSIVDRKEILDKLAAAEWFLLNDDKMMIDNPEDPYNKIPNWGNRYWKTLTKARESLGIDKHISMRELIQGDYAEVAKATNSPAYNETQFDDYVLDPDVRELHDSMEMQKVQFATQSAAVNLNETSNKKTVDNLVMTSERMQFTVEEENEATKMKNAPKSYNFITEHQVDLKLDGRKSGR